MNDIKAFSRVWVEVDGTTLLSNFLNIVSSVSPCDVIVVLKANAYGLGVKEFAKVLSDDNILMFALFF